MTRRLIVSAEAVTDIKEAVAWLRKRSPSLPVRFGIENEKAYSSIVEHPEMYPTVYRRFRRALLRRFPYSVIFTIEAGAILVVGVVHQARDDSTWKRRA